MQSSRQLLVRLPDRAFPSSRRSATRAPPREDSSRIGDEKPRAENIEPYLWTIPSEADEGVVVLVGRRLAAGREPGIAQSRSAGVLAEGKHNMDKADAGLVGLDNPLSKFAFGLHLLEARFHRG